MVVDRRFWLCVDCDWLLDVVAKLQKEGDRRGNGIGRTVKATANDECLHNELVRSNTWQTNNGMNKLFSCAVAIVLSIGFYSVGNAQHCPPIVESYLSDSKVTRTEGGFQFKFVYSKTGGDAKQAYQAYLVAFSDKSATNVAQLTPQQAIQRGQVALIKTVLIKRNKDGRYEFEFHLETEPFVKKLLDVKLISKDRIVDGGGWKSFEDQIQLAVFIPFLDDETYSLLDELPEDIHECNYRGDSALLFQPLIQKLQICFGIVQAVKLKEGTHYIQLNGARPTGRNARQ